MDALLKSFPLYPLESMARTKVFNPRRNAKANNQTQPLNCFALNNNNKSITIPAP